MLKSSDEPCLSPSLRWLYSMVDPPVVNPTKSTWHFKDGQANNIWLKPKPGQKNLPPRVLWVGHTILTCGPLMGRMKWRCHLPNISVVLGEPEGASGKILSPVFPVAACSVNKHSGDISITVGLPSVVLWPQAVCFVDIDCHFIMQLRWFWLQNAAWGGVRKVAITPKPATESTFKGKHHKGRIMTFSPLHINETILALFFCSDHILLSGVWTWVRYVI